MIEKILVADDEPLMLHFIAETLRRQGKEAVSYTHLTLPTILRV